MIARVNRPCAEPSDVMRRVGPAQTSLAARQAMCERPGLVNAISGDGWQLALPPGVIAKPATARGYLSGVIARGFIGDAPVTVLAQVRDLPDGFNRWVDGVAAHWLAVDRRRIAVPGAADAVRLDGLIDFDGLGAADDRERCTTVCAKKRRRGYALTARSRPEDAVHGAFEAVIASFELLD